MAPTNEPAITDLRRELAKARDALAAAEQHLARHAEMNAALHCATNVMYSPLHAKVASAIAGIDHALARTKPGRSLPTLDHHSSDGVCACGDCGGESLGNPFMPYGNAIGYGLRGEQIVMPDREHKHDPAAWRQQPTEDNV